MNPQGSGSDKAFGGGGGARNFGGGGNFCGGGNFFRGRGYSNFGGGFNYGKGNNNYGGGNFQNNSFGRNFGNGSGQEGGSGGNQEMTEEELRAKLQKIEALKAAKQKETVVAMAAGKEKEDAPASGAGKEVAIRGDCFSCGKSGHPEAACPKKLVDQGLHLCGFGIPGQLFHSIWVELDEGEENMQQVSGVLTVTEGHATEEQIVRELCELYAGQEVWSVRELAPNSFLVVFPNKECRRDLTKLKKGFFFVTADIKATVMDSQLDAEAFEVLTDVWVRGFGIPQWAKKEKVVRQLALFVGEPKYVDKASLAKQKWVRVRVGVKNPAMVGGVNSVFINGQDFHIRWEVEGVYEARATQPPNGGPGGSGSGAGFGNGSGSEGGNGHNQGGPRELGNNDGGNGGGFDGNMDEDDLLGEEAEDEEKLDYGEDDSQDHAPGWEKVVRYASGGSMESPEKSRNAQEANDCQAMTEIISRWSFPPVITLPGEDTLEVAEKESENWIMAPCKMAKRQKKNKQPVMATRFSKRINKDGIPVQQKAEARRSDKDKMTAMEAVGGRQASACF